jgi:hypothetical protein
LAHRYSAADHPLDLAVRRPELILRRGAVSLLAGTRDDRRKRRCMREASTPESPAQPGFPYVRHSLRVLEAASDEQARR